MGSGSLPKKLALAAGRYLREHPEALVRAAKSAARLELGVPLPLLRVMLAELLGNKAPREWTLESRSPGFFLSAVLDLMKTPLRASAVVTVEGIDFTKEALFLDLRVTGLQLEVLDENSSTPIAALLRSGALDLTRPGDLVSYLPKGSPILVEAKGNRFRLDLLKHPKLTEERARAIVTYLTPLVSLATVRGTTDDHLDLGFRPFPQGAKEALMEWKRIFE